MDEKLKEYKERHIRWQNISITQMGFTNNILITIAIGFLAFAFKDKDLTPFKFCLCGNFNWFLLLNFLSLIFLFVSITNGILTSLSRLYDFRITRNITLTRQRFYEYAMKNKLSKTYLFDFDFPNPKCKEGICAIKLIFHGIDVITKNESSKIRTDYILRKKFNNLRKLSKTLGILSWLLLRCQLVALLISLFFYTISLFVKS
jgi:hypothetical protein